jgi:hypothetical protein
MGKGRKVAIYGNQSSLTASVKPRGKMSIIRIIDDINEVAVISG